VLRSWQRAIVGLAVTVALAGCATSDANSGPANSGPTHGGPTSTHKVDNPLSSARLYVSPESPAAHQVAVWRSLGQGADAATLQRIARQSTATWLTGNQPPAVAAAALVRQSSRVGATAQIVLYDIPDRDCQGYSTGGAANSSQYLAWVGQVARGIGDHSAIIILEPDAIDQAASGCLSSSAAAARYQDLAKAVTTLKADPRAHVYIDAGNSGWLPVSRIEAPLRAAGIEKADGFALNVANFETTKASVAYGRALSRDLGGRHFVIDTSRNGAGPPQSAAGVDHWCNPPGRALGAAPTTHTGYPLVDAFLWIKYPGESDGQCGNGDPPAGTWWPSYGLALAQASSQR
jgi:endoglucanase